MCIHVLIMGVFHAGQIAPTPCFSLDKKINIMVILTLYFCQVVRVTNYTCRVMMDLADVILEPPAVMALDIVGMVLMKLTVSRHNSTPTCTIP